MLKNQHKNKMRTVSCCKNSVYEQSAFSREGRGHNLVRAYTKMCTTINLASNGMKWSRLHKPSNGQTLKDLFSAGDLVIHGTWREYCWERILGVCSLRVFYHLTMMALLEINSLWKQKIVIWVCLSLAPTSFRKTIIIILMKGGKAIQTHPLLWKKTTMMHSVFE